MVRCCPAKAAPYLGQLWGQVVDPESELAPHMPLTDVSIRSAKPKDKTFNLFDSGRLYLEVYPAGAGGGVGSTAWVARINGFPSGSIPMLA
jgi:hypothetical protein